MKSAPKHPQEAQRLEALHKLRLLDSLHETDFDDIALIATQICGTPVALVSWIDETRQVVQSKLGMEISEVPRGLTLCAHTILQDDIFVIENIGVDPRFNGDSKVRPPSDVQFYAGAPLRSPDGFPIGTLCVIDSRPRHLSAEQIRALKALSIQVNRLLQLRSREAETEQLFENLNFKKTAVDNLSEGVVLMDADGKLVDFNPASIEVLGATPGELANPQSRSSSWGTVGFDGLPLPSAQFPSNLALKTGQAQRNILVGIAYPNLPVRWLRTNATPIFAVGSKKASHVVTSFVDVTEQTVSREELIRKEAELSCVLNGLPAMIGHWDKNLRNIQANKTYAAHFGITPENMKGKHLKEIALPGRFEEAWPHIQEALNGRSNTVERKLNDQGGEIRHGLVTYLPEIVEGQVQGYFIVVTDITELKRSELMRQKLESKLVESTRLSTLGEMASGVAHEINNPLAIIIGKSQLMRRSIENGKANFATLATDIEKLEETALRISKIIKGLRAFSRDASGDQTEDFGVHLIVQETLELCRARFSKNGIDLRVTVDPALAVTCRPTEVSQILMKLIENAADAVSTFDEKWIEISAKMVGSKVQIGVTDAGRGIPDHIVAKMMQPFFTTKSIGEGAGLGLSISRGLALAQGGSLVYDRQNPHTKFILELPAGQSHQQTKAS